MIITPKTACGHGEARAAEVGKVFTTKYTKITKNKIGRKNHFYSFPDSSADGAEDRRKRRGDGSSRDGAQRRLRGASVGCVSNAPGFSLTPGPAPGD
jgi:hypothetical protein